METGYDAMMQAVQKGTPIDDFVSGLAEPLNVAEIKKTDAKLQIAYAEVYAPNIPDSHGDFMVPEEIRKMAHGFMRNGLTKSVDIEHDNKTDYDCAIVESFIAREGDPDFIPGSWVCGCHIPNPEVWELVEKGEINGFSMQGMGLQTDAEILIDLPPFVKGLVSKSEDDGHWHAFEVRFDDEGNFEGGKTIATFPAGHPDHTHLIKRGTITEPAGGKSDPHVHRFSFVEGIQANAAA